MFVHPFSLQPIMRSNRISRVNCTEYFDTFFYLLQCCRLIGIEIIELLSIHFQNRRTSSQLFYVLSLSTLWNFIGLYLVLLALATVQDWQAHQKLLPLRLMFSFGFETQKGSFAGKIYSEKLVSWVFISQMEFIFERWV